MPKPTNLILNPASAHYADLVELHPFTDASGDTVANIVAGGRDFTRTAGAGGSWVASSEGGRAWMQAAGATQALKDAPRTAGETRAAGTAIAVVRVPAGGNCGWMVTPDIDAMFGGLAAGIDGSGLLMTIGYDGSPDYYFEPFATQLDDVWLPVAIAWAAGVGVRYRALHPIDGIVSMVGTVQLDWPGFQVFETNSCWMGRAAETFAYAAMGITWHQRFNIALTNAQIDAFLAAPYQSVMAAPAASMGAHVSSDWGSLRIGTSSAARRSTVIGRTRHRIG